MILLASSQKKTTPAKKAPSRAASNRRSERGRGQPPRTDRPIRREVGALVCLLLAVFAVLGCFRVKALFIDLLGNVGRGLLGWGFLMLPLALLGAAAILAFHRGRPVQLRVWCVMLLPVALGSMLHLLLAGRDYTWSAALIGQLWTDGKLLSGGGVLSGLLAQLLAAGFSRFGAGVILAFLTVGLSMAALHITPADLLDWLRDRPRADYEEEPEPERPVRRGERKAPADKSGAPVQKPGAPSGRDRRRSSIDIPVDDGPLAQAEEREAQEDEPEEPVKRSFFDRRPRVPTPDQVLLTGAAKKSPPAETMADLDLEEAPPEPDRPPVPEPLPVYDEVPAQRREYIPSPPEAPAAARDVPPMPEIVREPAVPKLKKGEAAEAVAQIEQEAAQRLAQPSQSYLYPPVSLLDEGGETDTAGVAGELRANQARLEDTIHSFGIEANVVNVTRGPSVTRYELELDQGVRLNKLTNLADDIALALGASGVRIAPIPDKISVVGIEVPNKLVTPVPISEVIGSDAFQKHRSKVAFAVGKDIAGNCVVGNIAKLPHLLIAGTTGSGKSVCTNSLIISLLYKASPEEVRLIMVDPKMVELGIYNGIPHLLIPVVTDPKKAAGALQWAVVEMMRRYRAFSEIGVRKLEEYNAKAVRTEGMETMPSIVVVIDELADLMLVAAKEVEESICRVAQMGRAAGIHLIIATQRPSADVITGLMKANIPSRIAFAVKESINSRIILDQAGAEKLVGRGDMLYFPIGEGKPTRVQGCFISDEEVARVVEFVKRNSGSAQYDESVMHDIERNAAGNEKGGKGAGGGAVQDAADDSYDELLPSAIEVVVDTGMASVSMLQRRLKLGYSRAARLVDQMEEKGIVGPFEGSKPRQVLITKEQWQEMQFKQGMVDRAPDAPPAAGSAQEPELQEDAAEQSRKLPPFDIGEEDF